VSTQRPLAGDQRGQVHPVEFDAKKAGHSWSRLWAARFVAKWEGFSPDAVLDEIAFPHVWTIGFGHTGGVQPGEVWTREHAEKVLEHDIGWAAAALAQKVTHRLTVRQRMALISFVFNLGPGVLDGEFLRAINTGKLKRAADMMLDYDHAGGVVVEGLLNRRRAERWMMIHPLHPRNPHHPPKHKKRSTK
jgi:GH24 family phage-related lysozyme (muramidase)